MFRLTALAATEDRRRSTGEPHQALHALLRNSADVLAIPAARQAEQARLEAAVFLGICSIGGLSRHPLGIVQVRPEPDELTLRLLDEPYVIRYWADFLLPRTCNGATDHKTDPRDRITGVAGLRWRHEDRGILLYRPTMPARILLNGFNPRWWERAAGSMQNDYPPLQDEPDWTPAERAAYAAAAASRLESPAIFSPLLRRIRATAGSGPINATDAWSTMGGFRLETTDGPPCPDLIHLLATGPTGLGWDVEHKQCSCLCDHNHGNCNIDFRDPATGQCVYYSNSKWGRTESDGHRRRTTAEMNRTAFA
jgi:hypothetical protein